MITYIALLRGINVGGQKKVPMLTLRELLSSINLKNVQTYIQTGNVIFQSSQKEKSVLKDKIYNVIKNHFGFEVPILITTPNELQQIVKNYPFEENKILNSYFTLLHNTPENKYVIAFKAIDINFEEVFATTNCVYFFSEKGYGKAKCNNNFIERKLKVDATTRNYKTMIKLLELSKN